MQQEQRFEVRRDEPQAAAETLVGGGLESVRSKAFSGLFEYISCSNRKRQALEMTAPVAQEAISEKIEMTSPAVHAVVSAAV